MDISWRYFVEKDKCNFVEISEEDSKKLKHCPRAIFVMDGQSYGVVVTIYSNDIRLTETAQEFNTRKRKDFKKFLAIVGEI
jgi:hypothetical protein